MNKRASVLLLKIFAVATAAVCLCYVLTILVFSKLGSDAYADIKTDEMIEKTKYIAQVTAPYLEGRMTDDRYRYMLGDGSDIWGAAVYAYDVDWNIILRVTETDTYQNRKLADKYLGEVLAGKDVVDIDGIVIGSPVVSSYGNVIGAVMMVKPITELKAAISTVKRAMTLSCILAVAAMVLPIYLVVNRVVKPIQKMTDAAKAMAIGDYSIIADEKGHDEVASLGKSLNGLASSLAVTVGDLKAERNKLQEILDGMSDGVIAFNSKCEVVQFNPAAVRLLGGECTIPVDTQQIRDLLRKIELLNNSDDKENDFEMAHGEAVLHFSINKLASKNTDDINTIVLIHDVTEFARYEQSRRDYVANVSHELRTPIASIKSISEAFYDGLIHEDDVKKYYGYLLSESSRLSRLINDLLELSRIQSGKIVAAKRKTDVYEIVMGVADRYSVVANKNGMNIIPECDENIPMAYTNGDRAEQVLIIMVDNAIKHSDSHDVLVKAEASHDKITVSVSNSGSIDERDLPHLFERFYKADKSHSGEGTGLGLSIASEIMTMMDEKIWAESKDGMVTFAYTLSRADNGRE